LLLPISEVRYGRNENQTQQHACDTPQPDILEHTQQPKLDPNRFIYGRTWRATKFKRWIGSYSYKNFWCGS